MEEDLSLDSLVIRRVVYRYHRRNFSFDLSQALFSSAGVDVGTSLLLALIAEHVPLSGFSRVVDFGCGTGTLGICLAAAGSCELEAIDRDALAVGFTARNARLNGVDRVVLRHDVSPGEPAGGRELIVSNLPAKVGAPVLRLLVAAMARRSAAAGGVCAAVIVKPLADLLRSQLEALGAQTLADRRTANHEALLFTCPEAPEISVSPDDFVRDEQQFMGPDRPYRIRTVYNLPEFDGLSFATALAFDLMRGYTVSGSLLVYGVGQGHLVVGAAQRIHGLAPITIADRDRLALDTTSANAERLGVALADVRSVPGVGSLARAEQSAATGAWLVINDVPVSATSWNDSVATAAVRLLGPAGKLLLVSRSTAVSRFERSTTGLVRLAERRMRGFRAALYRRR